MILNKTEHPSNISLTKLRNYAAVFLRWYLFIFVFLLPFKFGTFAGGGEMPDFPLNLMEWLIFTCWPSFFPSIFAGFALLLAILIYPFPKLNKHFFVPTLSLIMLFAGFAGFYNTTEWNYALNWFWHFLGAFCISLSIYIIKFYDKKLLPGLLNCVAIASLICCLQGWRQHFGGLEANRILMEQNAETTGIELTQQIQDKLLQTRAYGSFVDPNIYAGHLLLSCPLMLLALYRWSKRFEPQKISKILFLSLGAILFVGALFFSGSRGALLGFAGGLAVFLWLSPLQLRWRILLLSCAFVLGCAFIMLANYTSKRDLLSASVRLEYYQTSWQIFKKYPLVGAGLGEFFPWHMRLKAAATEEARDPHSLFFALLGQCGSIGLIVALCRIFFPLALVFGFLHKERNKDYKLFVAVSCAWLAWLLHAQFQFNDTIAGTHYISAFIGFWAFRNIEIETESSRNKKKKYLTQSIVIIVALLAILPVRKIKAEKSLQEIYSATNLPYEAKVRELKSLEKKLPFSPVPCRFRAELALQRGDFNTALEANKILVQRSAHRSSSYCRLARVQILMGELNDAEKNLQKAALWYPYNPRLFPLLAAHKMLQMPHFVNLPIRQRFDFLNKTLSAEASLQLNEKQININLKNNFADKEKIDEKLLQLLNLSEIKTINAERVLFYSE